MKRLLRTLALLAGSGLVGCRSSAPPAATTAGPPGQQVYQQNCQPCHGATGDGNGSPAKSLVNVERQPDEEIRRVIEDGRRKMPAWKGKLTTEQITAVQEYIKQF